MKRRFHDNAIIRWTVLVSVLMAAFAAASAAQGIFSQPGLVTSIGQSSDIAVVKALLNTKLKLGLEVKPLAQPVDLAGVKTLIVVLGSSTKGLGAAGLNVAQEMERAKSLLAAAREKGVQILAMHIGGEARRGKTTNDFIEVVIPESRHVVVVASGNQDKLFNTQAAAHGTGVTEVPSLAAAGDAVQSLFRQ